MADLSTSADSDPQQATWANVDLSALEDRLNQLGSGENAIPEQPQQASLLDHFLADETQCQLSCRSGIKADDSGITETVTQYNRVEFEMGQTRRVLHIPFQPDLIGIPRVEANLIDGTGRARITATTQFGVRIELQLSETPQESLKICVESICTATLRE